MASFLPHPRCQATPRYVSRRDWLARAGGGLGLVALADLLRTEGLLAADVTTTSDGARSATGTPPDGDSPESPTLAQPGETVLPGPHFAPRARRVIQLFMSCGVSQVDSWDYKPALAKYDGQEVGQLPGVDELFFAKPGKWMQSPFRFSQHGQCGRWCSEMFPLTAQHADRLALVHSMTAASNSHAPACFLMNTGFMRPGYPATGAWALYGLGRVADNLPGYVVLVDRGLPPGHNVNWSAGFLPAQFQGVQLRPQGDPILDLRAGQPVPLVAERAGAELLAALNQAHLAQHPGDGELAARIAAFELAARMQTSVPEAVDRQDETAEVHRLYGLDHPNQETADFARNCLLARRLVERGVRFVTLFCGGPNMPTGKFNWDAHDNVEENHRRNALISDQPIAALLTDLDRRGLLEDTLVTWTGEFGRTPMREGETRGRDHNTGGFTLWMCGAGVAGGVAHGATDDFGYRAVSDPHDVHDFHATLLHLLGLDHERLTYYYNGRRQRLTDVSGRVITPVLRSPA